jgi:hypothetical protein
MEPGDIIKSVKKEGKVIKGEETKDKEYSSENTYPDPAAAGEAFSRSKQKLFDINAWSDLPGLTSAFVLHDHRGQPKPAGGPEPGDFILIELPGPLPENWVKITSVHAGEKEAEVVVHPSHSPKNREAAAGGETEHFFSSEASSTFRVRLDGNTVRAWEIGRNERINNHGTEAGNRGVINTLVAEGGWAFFQRMQWKKLTQYLVHLQD